MARNFTELQQAKRGTCPRCNLNKTVGRVQVVVQSYDGEPARGPRKAISSRSFSLCEECCVVVYQTVKDLLEEAVGDSSSR